MTLQILTERSPAYNSRFAIGRVLYSPTGLGLSVAERRLKSIIEGELCRPCLAKSWFDYPRSNKTNQQDYMTQFFIHDGQTEKGPLDIEQLKSEPLQKDTPVWYEGLDNWTTAGEIEELQLLFVPKRTPPPLNRNAAATIAVNPLVSYPTSPDDSYLSTPKKSLKVPAIIASVILVIGIVGWLAYQNNSQAEILNEVQQKVSQQDQEQQQQQLEHQQIQAEKDRVNAALTEKYMGYRNNWRSYITATNNAYSYSELGGISNLEVVVSNNTDKSIDEVQVKVDYIKANGGTYKSESVSVTNIGPNARKSVAAPSSDRGTFARMKIESITARSFHFCYPYGMDGNKNLDPYFCK